MSTSEANNQNYDQNLKYHDLLDSYVKEIPGKMFIIEITKCCNYSTFVLMYRDESLIDLYRRVSFHMGCDIVSLYILTCDNSRITVPINSNKTMKEFIYSQTDLNNRTMKPIYDVPLPVVYRIYLDDGHHHHHDDHTHNNINIANASENATFT